MKSDLYKAVEQFVADSFGKTNHNTVHLMRTAYWAEQLRPTIDEAFLIAAVSHDIERSVGQPGQQPVNFTDEEFLKRHQEKGAELMRTFLTEKGARAELINRVCHLIERHEVGGDADQNFLKDVDSLSFFENNIPHFLQKMIPAVGTAEVKKKFTWMYERISDPEVKELAEPDYLDAIEQTRQAAKINV